MIKKLFFGSLVILGLVIAAGAFFGCGEVEKVQVTGLPGADGTDGTDGASCTIVGSVLTCPDGSSFDLSELEGKDGEDGTDGLDGKDGLSCTVAKVDECVVISCEDGTEAEICSNDNNDDDEDDGKNCNNGKGNGSEGCSPSDNGNDDE